MLKYFLTLAVYLSLTGCGLPERLDATDAASLKKSLDAAEKELYPKDRPKFNAARKKFEAIYAPGNPDIAKYPDMYAVHKMTASEFYAFVQDISRDSRVKRHEAYIRQPANYYPSPAITQRLLDQYRLEKTLNDLSKDTTWLAGKNTVDQYPIVDTQVIIPPPGDLPVAMDKVKFIISMKNQSGFDAYVPTFRVTITTPQYSYPIYTGVFVDAEAKKDVIRPYQVKTSEFTCCSIASDPYFNKIMKGLDETAQVKVEVISVKSHNNQELISTELFNAKHNERSPIIDACIKLLENNLKTWVPPTRPEEGECGQYSERYASITEPDQGSAEAGNLDPESVNSSRAPDDNGQPSN